MIEKIEKSDDLIEGDADDNIDVIEADAIEESHDVIEAQTDNIEESDVYNEADTDDNMEESDDVIDADTEENIEETAEQDLEIISLKTFPGNIMTKWKIALISQVIKTMQERMQTMKILIR